jgi:hypothetical protein
MKSLCAGGADGKASDERGERGREDVTILEALADRNLFGNLPAFRDLETWSAWRAFLASVYALPMTRG